ncbi:MAG: hypothetical protein QME58_12450 [Bacteroidota bacterium]|nr:hypothetical protein [Bacteroidota bacterium]
MSNYRNTILLLKKDFSLIAILFAGILFIPAAAYKINYLAFTSFLIGFTAFDLLGFKHTLDFRDGVPRIAYRIVQTSFQIIFTALIYVLFGWQTAAACLIAWWFTACDVLYYLLGKYPFPPKDYPITWLNWSVLGVIRLIVPSAFGRFKINTLSFIIAAVIGTLTGIVIILYL